MYRPLANIHDLDESVTIHETKHWIEQAPTATATIVEEKTTKLDLSKVMSKEAIGDSLLAKHAEYLDMPNRDGTSSTIMRVCITHTRNLGEIMKLMTSAIRKAKARVVVDICRTSEMIEACAGWLMGMDPIFISAQTIHDTLYPILVKKYGISAVPTFYAKKQMESSYVNSKDDMSKAPVVKIMCDVSGLATMRTMLAELELKFMFTKFIMNNTERSVKWAMINDHIDEILSKKYVLITGPGMGNVDNILMEKVTDESGTEGLLNDFLMNNGIIPVMQSMGGQWAIFAQINVENLGDAMTYLDKEFANKEGKKRKNLIDYTILGN